MSFTSEEEEITNPIENVLESFRKLEKVIRCRIKNQKGWSLEHLDELHMIHKDILDLEIRLRKILQ